MNLYAPFVIPLNNSEHFICKTQLWEAKALRQPRLVEEIIFDNFGLVMEHTYEGFEITLDFIYVSFEAFDHFERLPPIIDYIPTEDVVRILQRKFEAELGDAVRERKARQLGIYLTTDDVNSLQYRALAKLL